MVEHVRLYDSSLDVRLAESWLQVLPVPVPVSEHRYSGWHQ